MGRKKKQDKLHNVVFICTANLQRSVLANELMKIYGDHVIWNSTSAGVYPYNYVGDRINGYNKWESGHFENTYQYLIKEYDIDINYHSPKGIDQLYGEFDYVVLMGDDVVDSFCQQQHRIKWKNVIKWDFERHYYDTEVLRENIKKAVKGFIKSLEEPKKRNSAKPKPPNHL